MYLYYPISVWRPEKAYLANSADPDQTPQNAAGLTMVFTVCKWFSICLPPDILEIEIRLFQYVV